MTDRIILNREIPVDEWENLADIVAHLQEIGVPLEEATIGTDFVSEDWYRPVLIYRTPETDAEYNKRMKNEKKRRDAEAERKKKKAEQERAEYERLKKKFGE